MKVLIIGAASFIGRELGEYLHARGIIVYGTVRKNKFATFKPVWLNRCTALDLREPLGSIDGLIFKNIDVVLHLAHDFGKDMADVNILAAEALAAVAAKAGVSRQIFFSSYSARPDALSEYGIVKYRIEQYFLKKGYLVIRPGLVIGKGGMFLKMFEAVRKSPVIPLPDGGNSDVPVISVRQLCEALHKIISSSMSGQEFNLFYPEMTSMRTLADAMKIATGSRAPIIPFPSGILTWAANIGKRIGIKLPFNPDSAKSYKANLIRLHKSSLDGLVDRFDSVQEAVNAAFPV